MMVPWCSDYHLDNSIQKRQNLDSGVFRIPLAMCKRFAGENI